jgi:hypothetical protein
VGRSMRVGRNVAVAMINYEWGVLLQPDAMSLYLRGTPLFE